MKEVTWISNITGFFTRIPGKVEYYFAKRYLDETFPKYKTKYWGEFIAKMINKLNPEPERD
jgi:hypothetical protein